MSGNKHHASREWLVERISGAISIPLLIWLVVNLISFKCGCYKSLGDFLSRELNVILLIIFIGNFLFYSTLAMKVVFEDYVSNTGVRNFLIKLMYVAGVAGFALAVYAIYTIHQM